MITRNEYGAMISILCGLRPFRDGITGREPTNGGNRTRIVNNARAALVDRLSYNHEYIELLAAGWVVTRAGRRAMAEYEAMHPRIAEQGRCAVAARKAARSAR